MFMSSHGRGHTRGKYTFVFPVSKIGGNLSAEHVHFHEQCAAPCSLKFLRPQSRKKRAGGDLEGCWKHTAPEKKKKKEKEVKKLRRQRKLPLHQLRKERHIGLKSHEPPSPNDERGINVDHCAD
eukprot:532154-Pelagomonas_calceolata.AAC.1